MSAPVIVSAPVMVAALVIQNDTVDMIHTVDAHAPAEGLCRLSSFQKLDV